MKFFCDTIDGKNITLIGEDARHLIKSLRVRLGERVVVCDGRGSDYICSVATINADTVDLNVERVEKSTAELEYSLTLYQCIPKGEKWDFILQKSVELGVTKIVPVMSKNCVARLTPAEFEKKRGRYEKIILSAAKQSGRGKIPELATLMDVRQAFDELLENGLAIFCYENASKNFGEVLKSTQSVTSVGMLIGAEGGFTDAEVEYGTAKGLEVYSLGDRILRAETAAVAVLSAVSIIL